jgi:hypothetical protein
MKLAPSLHFLAVEAKSLIFQWRVLAESTHTRAVIMNPVTRHVWLIARHFLKCPANVPAMSRSNPTVENQCKACHPRGGRSGSRLVFASRATPCTASAFVLILRTHTRCKSRNPYKARRTAAEFARWSAWSCPRRMSASISRSRNSMPRNRNPLRRRSRCRSIRAADDERGSSFVAGDSFTVPGS